MHSGSLTLKPHSMCRIVKSSLRPRVGAVASRQVGGCGWLQAESVTNEAFLVWPPGKCEPILEKIAVWLLAGREARRCVCCIVQSSNTWGLKQLVFCYKLLIWDWICEMSFSLSQSKTITGLCKAEWSRTNFRLADQACKPGSSAQCQMGWDVWAEEQMEGSTHSFQGWLLATEPWAGRWTVSIVRLVTLGTSERSRGHAWIPNLYEIGKAFRNMKSRIKQPLLCLDRLNAFPSISFRYFFYTSN